MNYAFLDAPRSHLRAELPAQALADALVLCGDVALQPHTGETHTVDAERVYSLARRVRAYAGGHAAAAALETDDRVLWATFAPPLVPAMTLVRVPPGRTRSHAAPPRLVLGTPRAPATSPIPGLSLLISDQAGPGACAGYTLPCRARTPAMLAAALEVGRRVADATFVEAASRLDWPLLARHAHAHVFTECTTLEHALLALAPPDHHAALRRLLQRRDS